MKTISEWDEENEQTKIVYPYAKIPYNIIVGKEHDYRRTLLYTIMYLRMPIIGEAVLYRNNTYERYGLYINDHSWKQCYSDLLEWYSSMGYIQLEWLDNYKNKNAAFITKLSPMACDGKSERYGTVFYYELQAICNINYGDLRKSKVNQAHVILVLAYIRCSMTFKEGFFVHGCYNHISSISEDIGLSDTIIMKCIEYLEQLEILKVKKLKRFIHDGCWKTNYTVFTNAKDIYDDFNYGEDEINKIIKYIEYRKEIVYSM